MSTNATSFEKSTIAECDADIVIGCPRSPFDVETQRQHDDPVRNPAVNVARSLLWKPLYLTSLVVMVAVLVLFGVSTTIDMFYMDVRPPQYISKTVYAPVCESGCAAADKIVADDLFEQGQYDVRQVVNTEIIPQMRPFAVTSCTERNAGVYDIAAGSQTAKARGTFQVDCTAFSVTPRYTDFKYAEGFTFFHAVGAPRIHRMDYPVENQTVPVVAILFVVSGLSLIFHVAVVALRATLSEALISRTRTQCCGCNGPNHVRRLTAAVISFLVLGVVMTFVQFGLCGYGKAPSDCGERCAQEITVTGGYWALLVIILVLQLIALSLVCACYAMRV